jgi:hypothetical protein
MQSLVLRGPEAVFVTTEEFLESSEYKELENVLQKISDKAVAHDKKRTRSK